MLEYLIKSGLCLLVLFSFYKLFMEGEQFHKIKRGYLLLSLLVSLMLPLLTITYEVELATNPSGDSITSIINEPKPAKSMEGLQADTVFTFFLVFIYAIGFLTFAYRFYRNLKKLLLEASENTQLRQLNYIYVLLGRKLDPHTFLNYIFLNKEEYKKDRISTAVIEHEKAHVDQKHSLDLLLIEILQVIFWFNPVFLLMRKSIKLNHEFLADQAVLKKKFNPVEYSNILIDYSSGHHHNSLSSPINHSLIKKRIIMISKTFSLRRLLLKSFIFLPILGGCIYLFNEQIVAKTVYVNSIPETEIDGTALQDKKTILIRVEDEKIWLNKKPVKLDDFTSSLNKLTSDWSQEEMENPWFEIDFQDASTEFIERLNQKYRKSKLSKISGTEFLAPSPLAPAGTPPPPPPPPVIERTDNVPQPPAPAPVPKPLEHSEAQRAHKESAREWRNMKDAEKKIIKEERQRIGEIEKQLSEDKRLSQDERRKMMREVERKEAQIQRKMKEVERKHLEIEREHRKIKREQKRIHDSTAVVPTPPKAPDPIESIDELEREGGSFFYNGNKISGDKAKELVRAKNYSKIEIHQTGDSRGKLEIMD